MKTCSLLSLITVSLFFSAFAGCASVQKHRVLSADDVPISYYVRGAQHLFVSNSSDKSYSKKVVAGAGKQISAGPTLVFVHGWCCDKRYWTFQVRHFERKYQVIAIDLAGHGESGLGRTDWTIEAFGRDVVAVIKKLDLDQVILIGHSMGGYVIIEAARQIPGRVIGLVGVDTLHDFDTEYSQEQVNDFISAFKKDFVKNTVSFVRGMFTSESNPELVKRITMDMSLAPPQVGIGSLQGYFNYDVRKALSEVWAPIYCINTDLLPTNVEANRQYAFYFRVKLMPGMSHFIMIEDPKTFNKLLDETIDELVQLSTLD